MQEMPRASVALSCQSVATVFSEERESDLDASEDADRVSCHPSGRLVSLPAD